MSKKNSNVILKHIFKEHREFSKTYLNFKNKLKKFKNKSFVVAVSGGPDSLALVALSQAYSLEKKIKFHYVLINHNIRKNSSSEAEKVKNLLKKNKINLTIISNKIEINKNIQSNARKIRYKKLSTYCQKKKVKILLTAHNLEDQVETFFIRLSRGSGLKGLSSMKLITQLEKNVYLYRPLLDIKKNALIKISKAVFNKYFKDPSNKDNKFMRTRIRSLEKPLKKSGISYDQIYKSINNLASSEAILEKYFIKITKETIKWSKNEILINFHKFNDFDKEIKIRMINRSIKVLKKNYYDSRSKKVVNLIKKLEDKKFKSSTLGGCIFVRKKDKISVKIEKNYKFLSNK